MILSFTSPSANLTTKEDRWVVWQKNAPVFELHEKGKTDRRYSDSESVIPSDVEPGYRYAPPGYYAFQCNQYNAVLSKFNHASRRAGQFSSWDT